VIGTSEIVITSQVAGRITSLPAGLGANVSNGQTVVQLLDTAGSIRFGLERSQLAARSAQDSYAVQKANLEKQIADSQIALQRAQL
jgi:multidrug resistance efflux pump